MTAIQITLRHSQQSNQMQSTNSLRTEHATLRACANARGEQPLMVHRETLLGELPSRGANDYVLVADDEDRLIGIVPAREINRRLLAANKFERSRWASMPIGAMSNMSFAEGNRSQRSRAGGEEEVACAKIHEGNELFGLQVEGDLFLSWRRLESLFTAALSDPLTGLMNRLAYERRLREEWNRSLRTGTSIGVVVVDLDEFKGVNDTYGHVVGDELLASVGHKLEVAMRSYDVVARFGGDEFVALCLGCGPGDIQIPVSRLLNSIAEIELQLEDGPLRIQASVGAAVRHSNFEHSLPEDLFVAADNCLYEAKKSTENAWRIEIGGDEEASPQPISCRCSSKPKTNGHSAAMSWSGLQ